MPSLPEPVAEHLRACGETIARSAAAFAMRGWTPATSSNFSMRLDDERIAITVSGRDKGALTADDVIAVKLDGTATETDRHPSAETSLHLQVYHRRSDTGAVLHTHSHNQTVASRLYAADGAVKLRGWELQKAITGFASHDSELVVPVFANSQDMADIEEGVAEWLDADKPLYGYLIEGHGLYTWGRDMPEATRHLEALEFLLACELDLIRLGEAR